jgi:hypothetical protein
MTEHHDQAPADAGALGPCPMTLRYAKVINQAADLIEHLSTRLVALEQHVDQLDDQIIYLAEQLNRLELP